MSKPSRRKILVAMPAYNEEKYLGSMVLKARQYADEVLVVDDGSTDQTAKIAQLAGATVFRYEENRGKGAAVRRIIAEARKRRPDILVLLDADSQHNPDDIALLIEPISRGSDVVIGSRVLKRKNIPRYRRIGQRVLTYLSHVLSGKNVADSECGFRALSQKAVADLELKQDGFAVDAEMISVASEKGLAIAEVPISASYTKDSSTLNPIQHGLGVLTSILVMISERRPVLFFGLAGSISTAIGIIAGIRTVQIVTTTGAMPIGTALVTLLCVIIGVSSIFTGIILNVLMNVLTRGRKG